MDSIFYRLSTRLSAPRMRPRSSLILGGGGCSSSSPSIARRRCVFCASRSSSRCEQMRNIRDETVSAEARYSSMSCTPAAKASSVGASPEVMRDNWAETADGVIGGRVVDRVEDSPSGWCEGLRDSSMACCEGSRREGLTSSCCDLREGCLSFCWLSGCGLALTVGIAGCRRSALRDCLSLCNLGIR